MGTVSGDLFVGGLVGYSEGTVENLYATGTVSGGRYVGGLVGMNTNTVENSYATGNVSGEFEVGGLVGENYGTVSNSFWDIHTSGTDISDGGTGKTTAEMMDITTFSNAGWDIVGVANIEDPNIEHIWNIVDTETYPFLSSILPDDGLPDDNGDDDSPAPGFLILMVSMVLALAFYMKKNKDCADTVPLDPEEDPMEEPSDDMIEEGTFDDYV